QRRQHDQARELHDRGQLLRDAVLRRRRRPSGRSQARARLRGAVVLLQGDEDSRGLSGTSVPRDVRGIGGLNFRLSIPAHLSNASADAPIAGLLVRGRCFKILARRTIMQIAEMGPCRNDLALLRSLATSACWRWRSPARILRRSLNRLISSFATGSPPILLIQTNRRTLKASPKSLRPI